MYFEEHVCKHPDAISNSLSFLAEVSTSVLCYFECLTVVVSMPCAVVCSIG